MAASCDARTTCDAKYRTVHAYGNVKRLTFNIFSPYGLYSPCRRGLSLLQHRKVDLHQFLGDDFCSYVWYKTLTKGIVNLRHLCG